MVSFLSNPVSDVDSRGREAAIHAAISYCESIGQPPVTPLKTVHLLNAINGKLNGEYSAPRWNVVFADGTEVEVLDNPRIIFTYSSLNERSTIFENEAFGDGPKLTADEAQRRADACLPDTEGLATLTRTGSFFAENFSPPQLGSSTWTIRYIRMVNGLIYRFQGADVDIDARTGKLKLYTLHLGSSEVTPRGAKVTSARAEYLALKVVSAKYHVHLIKIACVKAVVLPNLLFGATANREIPRVCWAIMFAVSAHGTGKVEVWVDCDDAAILGGQDFGPI